MGRHIYTTCGTSLLTSNCFQGISDGPAVSTIHLPHERAECEKIYRKYIQDRRVNPGKLAQEFDQIRCWDEIARIRQLPAELASLRVIQNYCNKTDPLGPLNKDDKVILVHAANEDALNCASVIRAILEEKKLLGDVPIELWEIKGLDFSCSNFVRSLSALENLWLESQKKLPQVPSSDGQKYYLNLTGGYKALGMLFACFGYAMGNTNTRIFYLNEEAGMNILELSFDSYAAHGEFKNLLVGNIDSSGSYITPSLHEW